MTPLEVARQLIEVEAPQYKDICLSCGRLGMLHAPDCAWMQLPQIVAALEVLAVFADNANWMGGEFHGPPGTFWRARQILGLEPPDDDEEAR